MKRVAEIQKNVKRVERRKRKAPGREPVHLANGTKVVLAYFHGIRSWSRHRVARMVGPGYNRSSLPRALAGRSSQWLVLEEERRSNRRMAVCGREPERPLLRRAPSILTD
jgi:hypothetical protein